MDRSRVEKDYNKAVSNIAAQLVSVVVVGGELGLEPEEVIRQIRETVESYYCTDFHPTGAEFPRLGGDDGEE